MKKLFSLFAAVLFAGSMMATTVTKTVEELATANSWENGVVVTPFALDEVISVSTEATDANTGKYYTSGQQIRLYQTGAAKLILTAAEGNKISSVTLTYASNNGGILVEAASETAVSFENVQSATFTVGNSGTATNGQARVTAISVTYEAGGVTPPEPQGCNWDEIAFLGNGSGNAAYTDRFKVCAGDPAPTNIVNIQAPGWAAEPGIYVSFPSAAFGAISLDASQYAIDGAGMVLYVSAFLYDAEKEVTIVCQDVIYTLTVKNANPETTPVVLPDPTNCAEAREAALSVEANNVPYKDSTIYSIQGYVTEIKTAYNDQFHNITFWMADAANGGQVLQAYRAACASADEAPIVGDKVTVTGALSKYNGTPQFMAGSTFVIDEHATPVVPQNLGEKTIAEFLTLANTVDTCVITGVVAYFKTNTDGSYNKFGNFDLVDGEASVYVYGLLTAAGEAQKFQEMGVDAGDTLTVKAVYSLFNNAPQAKNAIFVAVKKYVEPVVFNHELYGSEALPVVDKTWFATTDSWVEENNSHAEIVNDYDIHVALVDSKVGQWQSQVFVNPGFTWEVGAYYKMEFDLTTNNQLGGVTVKVNDNDSVVFYYSYPNDNVFLANQTTHFVADSIYAKAEPTNGGQLIFAFGWTAANTEILISNIVITKYEAPIEPQEIVLDVEYADAMHITQYGAWQLNLYKDYSQAEGVTYPDFYVILAEKSATTLAGTYSAAAGEIMLVQVFTSEKDSASAVQVTPFVITYKGDGVYNFNFAFLGDDGNTYILDTDLAPGAYEYGTWADIVLEDVAEGIENTEVLLNATKRIENGTLIIERNNVRYNVSGQVVR